MARCDELLQKAQNSPASLKFRELCALAECFGFNLDRREGSHCIYKRPGFRRIMNFQNFKGSAKPYQVHQLLRALRELGLIEQGEDDHGSEGGEDEIL